MAEPIPAASREVGADSTVASLTPVLAQAGSLVRPSAPTAEIERAFRDYTDLCERLLVPDDYQKIGKKDFRKKSAWRKLATAFGVSVELVWKEYEREGRHIIRAEVLSRAIAPNGRYMDGLGACDAFERCCEQPCKQAKWDNHTCCTDDCNGFRHFSKPNHDIPATAMTRATNRACADLFGMGEVSAEEVTDHGDAPVVQTPPAKAEGWADAAAEAAAHKAVADAIKTLYEDIAADHPIRAEIKAYRAEHGWPMSADNLKALMVTVAKATTPSEPQEAPETPKPAKSRAKAPTPAPEAPSTPTAAPEGEMPWDGMPDPDSTPAEFVCPWCENPVLPSEPAVITGGADGQLVVKWHKPCRSEHDAEGQEDDDPGRPFTE